MRQLRRGLRLVQKSAADVGTVSRAEGLQCGGQPLLKGRLGLRVSTLLVQVEGEVVPRDDGFDVVGAMLPEIDGHHIAEKLLGLRVFALRRQVDGERVGAVDGVGIIRASRPERDLQSLLEQRLGPWYWER